MVVIDQVDERETSCNLKGSPCEQDDLRGSPYEYDDLWPHECETSGGANPDLLSCARWLELEPPRRRKRKTDAHRCKAHD